MRLESAHLVVLHAPARLHLAANLQSAHLVVLYAPPSRLHLAANLQSAHLVVLHAPTAGFHIRFHSHHCHISFFLFGFGSFLPLTHTGENEIGNGQRHRNRSEEHTSELQSRPHLV